MHSIKKRLLVVGSIIVISFLVITAVTLEKAFRSVANEARNERLHSNVYTLLAAAELEGQKLVLPGILSEQRLMLPESGLYAYVVNNSGETIWHSPSALGLQPQKISFQKAGDEEISKISSPKEMLMLEYGVAWQSYDQNDYAFTVAIVEDSEGYNAQIWSYRNTLYGWMAGLAVILVVVQIYILKWGLSPLQKVEQDIIDIESGKSDALSGEYPKEIKGITHNLNILVENERKRLKQYRDTLANLAHSLKTPLAVLRNEVENINNNPVMLEQIDRIDSMVEYQLSRAALSGRITYASAIKVFPIAERLISALNKVFADKNINCELQCDADVEINAIEGDLMEILGNLLENAYKWTSNSVSVEIDQLTEKDARIKGVRISIEDNGPGIDVESVEHVLARGGRADTSTPGHGIGLAVVKDLVDSYLGMLIISKGHTGGALIKIEIPPR